MIEVAIRKYLTEKLEVPVYFAEPEKPPLTYIVIDKVGSSDGAAHKINHTMLAIQSIHAKDLGKAMELNHSVKLAMWEMAEENLILKAKCNSDINYTDVETHRYRYQALFDITYYETEE